jgi:hypothetical protein
LTDKCTRDQIKSSKNYSLEGFRRRIRQDSEKVGYWPAGVEVMMSESPEIEHKPKKHDQNCISKPDKIKTRSGNEMDNAAETYQGQ